MDSAGSSAWARPSALLIQAILTELLRGDQNRDQSGADQIVPIRAPVPDQLLRTISTPQPWHMNKADRARLRARERKIQRLIANIAAGIGRRAAAQALAAKRGFDLAIGKGGTRGIWRALDDRAERGACARGVAAKQTYPVQRPRFDAEKFPPRGEAEMENCIGLERFVELFEFSRDLGIVDGQHSGFEFNTEACQPRSMSAKRMGQRRRWVFSRTRKASEPRDENA
jgi:hypothetical protein